MQKIVSGAALSGRGSVAGRKSSMGPGRKSSMGARSRMTLQRSSPRSSLRALAESENLSGLTRALKKATVARAMKTVGKAGCVPAQPWEHDSDSDASAFSEGDEDDGGIYFHEFVDALIAAAIYRDPNVFLPPDVRFGRFLDQLFPKVLRHFEACVVRDDPEALRRRGVLLKTLHASGVSQDGTGAAERRMALRRAFKMINGMYVQRDTTRSDSCPPISTSSVQNRRTNIVIARSVSKSKLREQRHRSASF